MDKVKTGELIREARKAKNYTQSELGDLLGVTNKAVSRWEKGESFPDIGVLENLARVLDIKIQDIVVGEVQASEQGKDPGETTATEILRMAKVQIRSKIRHIWGFVLAALVLVCSVFVGIAGTSRMASPLDENGYYLLLLFTLAAVVCGGFMPVYKSDKKNGVDRLLIILSVALFAWMLIMVWAVSILVLNNQVKPDNAGPFIYIQLIVITVLNILFLIFELARMKSEFKQLHCGFIFQTASIYMAALYGDLLQRTASLEGYITHLTRRTVIVLVCTVAALLAMRLLQKYDEKRA